MAVSQRRSKRKISGSIYKGFRKKRQNELGGDPSFTQLEPRKIRAERVMGGNVKLSMLCANTANLYDSKAKAHKQAKIKTIAGNPANVNFVRRNIMTRGAIIDTEFGKARVTSRPGQHGVVNAVLI